MPKTFNLRMTSLWVETTQGLSDKMKKLVNEKVEIIKNNPFGFESLKGALEGLWSYNRFKTDNRIIFAICEDCRRRKLVKLNNCIGCENFSNETIMLWAFGGHDLYDKLGRQREKTWKQVKKKNRKR